MNISGWNTFAWLAPAGDAVAPLVAAPLDSVAAADPFDTFAGGWTSQPAGNEG